VVTVSRTIEECPSQYGATAFGHVVSSTSVLASSKSPRMGSYLKAMEEVEILLSEEIAFTKITSAGTNFSSLEKL